MRAVRRVWGRLWWYVRELFGETAYDHYVAHQRQHCPTGAVLSRREFERLKTAPHVRCC
jgi:uncharacterized short protein YbdD (DUF466 family)